MGDKMKGQQARGSWVDEAQVEVPDTCNGGLPDGHVHQHMGRCFREGVKAGYLAARREQALAEFAAAEHVRAHREASDGGS